MTSQENQEPNFNFNFENETDDASTLNYTLNCSYYDFDQFNNSVHASASNDKLSLIHYNATSLNKNFDKLCDDLHLIKFPFSIIGVTETWII